MKPSSYLRFHTFTPIVCMLGYDYFGTFVLEQEVMFDDLSTELSLRTVTKAHTELKKYQFGSTRTIRAKTRRNEVGNHTDDYIP